MLWFLGKVVTRIRTDKQIYTLQDLLKMLPVGEPYQWLCQFLIPCVVGSKTWNKKKHKELIGNVATCSDKTFVLLSLENNYEMWFGKAAWIVDNMDKELQDRAPKEFPHLLYTSSGQSNQNSGSRRLQGWAREGYLCCKMLYTLVEQDRFKRANFESELMLLWQRAFNKGKPTSQLANDDDNEEIFPANNLEGLTAPSANDLYTHNKE
jgi:hypothetical protein